MKRLDCIIIVDGDLSEMAERQLSLMLELHAKDGIKTGLLTLWQARPGLGWSSRSPIARQLEGDAVFWLDPKERYETELALILSPGLAGVTEMRLPHVKADAVLIWPIEPPRRGQRPLAEQAPDLSRRIGEQFGIDPIWCARTASERHHLTREAVGLDLAPLVWWPLLEASTETGRSPKPTGCQLIGRHWRDEHPLGAIAQQELAEAFGDAWPMDLAFQGPASVLRSLPATHESQGLRLIDPSQMTSSDFLGDLALFIALGAAEDPFGLPFEIFEAMTKEALVIGPAYLSSAIDASLPSADVSDLSGLSSHLMSDDRAFSQAMEGQRQLVAERHAGSAYRARIDRYLTTPGTPIMTSAAPARSRRKDRVLFVSDDSPHFEHLSREIAIADCLPPSLKPFFVTTGRDAWLAEGRGYPVEFVTPHNSPAYQPIGHGADGWNFWFERQFAELLRFIDPRAVVFDGVYPFGGMMANRARYPDIPFIWIRQPLWRPNAKREALGLQHQLDLIIEPGDLAADLDRGPTAKLLDHVLQTAPILTADLLPRSDARRRLGIAADETAILLDGSLPPEVLASEAQRVLIEGLIEGGASLWAFKDQQSAVDGSSLIDLGVRQIDEPSMRVCRAAFDGAISAADYRGLHDQAAAGLPTIFVVGLGSSNDDQAARLAYAERQGWAMALRQRDVYGARDASMCLLDPDRRRAMATRLAAGTTIDVSPKSGAEQAAFAIAETVFGVPLGALPGDGMADRSTDATDGLPG